MRVAARDWHRSPAEQAPRTLPLAAASVRRLVRPMRVAAHAILIQTLTKPNAIGLPSFHRLCQSFHNTALGIHTQVKFAPAAD